MSRRKKPEELAKEYIRKQKDQEGFEIKYIDSFIGINGFLHLSKIIKDNLAL